MSRWTVRRAAVLLGTALAVLAAAPVPAGAVLSGTNGRIVFASGRESADGDDSRARLYLRTILSGTGAGAAGPTFTVVPPGVQWRHPTWAPDRTKVAYARGTPGSPATENFDIYVHDLTTGAVVPITTEGDNVTSDRPAWSPDGTRIAFEDEVTNNSGQRDIAIFNVTTGGTLYLTNTPAIPEGKPAWTPDSQTLYYASGDPNVNANILREPAVGGTVTSGVPDSSISEFQPAISPDGGRICFTLGTGFNGTADVFVAPVNNAQNAINLSDNVGAGPQNGDYNCTWSPDGTAVAYVTGIFTLGALVMKSSDDTGGVITLEDNAANFDGNPDWAPDGTPECQEVTVNVGFNASESIPLGCTDTGPAYERTPVTESLVDQPQNGTLGPLTQGDPSTVTYTPNPGFSGTDSFTFAGTDVRSTSQPARVTINVSPAGVTPPANPPSPDTTAPVVTRTSVAPRRWRPVGSRGRSRTPVGTLIGYRLSEAARVTLTFQRLLPGRRVGRRCLRPAAGRRGRPCTRPRTAGSLTRADAAAGLNTLPFGGRLGRRRLALGRYRVAIAARDAAGNRSATRFTPSFTIVRR